MVTKKKEKELAEKYLKQRDFRKAEGFAINTQEMNPNDCDEIFFDGKELHKAIEDYFKKDYSLIYKYFHGKL